MTAGASPLALARLARRENAERRERSPRRGRSSLRLDLARRANLERFLRADNEVERAGTAATAQGPRCGLRLFLSAWKRLRPQITGRLHSAAGGSSRR